MRLLLTGECVVPSRRWTWRRAGHYVAAKPSSDDPGAVVLALLLGRLPVGHEDGDVGDVGHLDERVGAEGVVAVGDPVEEAVHEGVALVDGVAVVEDAVQDDDLDLTAAAGARQRRTRRSSR